MNVNKDTFIYHPLGFFKNGYVLSDEGAVSFWNRFEKVTGIFLLSVLLASIIFDNNYMNAFLFVSIFLNDFCSWVFLKKSDRVKNKRSYERFVIGFLKKKSKDKMVFCAVLISLLTAIMVISGILNTINAGINLVDIAWYVLIVYMSYVFIKNYFLIFGVKSRSK